MVCRNGEALCRSSFGAVWSFMRGCATTTDWIAERRKKMLKRLCVWKHRQSLFYQQRKVCVPMGLLLDAARAWEKMCLISYQFTYGMNKKLHHIVLSFQEEQFAHLSGIHYISDIDLSLPYKKSNFLTMVLHGNIPEESITRSCHWADITNRLEAIIRLERILDSDFSLYLFRANRLPFHSNIDASFLIKDKITGDTVFLFVSGELEASFCRSIFMKTNRDYSANQKRLAQLRKIKVISGETFVIFDRIK